MINTGAPPFPSRQSALAVIVSLLALGGCVNDHSSPEESDHHEEHAGHVIPAHKPKTFPDAVRRLRVLNDSIGVMVAEGRARSLVEDKTLAVALDIATWLPEIAADSDMPESPWNEVNARSVSLVADYEKVLAGLATGDRPANAPAAVRDANQQITSLETILAGADTRWFNEKEGKDAAP
jgi:hypothetical protein